jgi:hypothetical protein
MVAAPQPAALKTFQDWTVGCDNGRACQAVGLMPEADYESATMAVRRGPEPGSVPEIWINPGDAKPAVAMVDGKSFALNEATDAQDAPLLAPRDGPAFLRALAAAKDVNLVDQAGKRLVALSPRGASAAMLFMDEQQRRIGTVTALVRIGPKPPATVPPPPALPEIRQPPVSSKPARTLGAARVRQMLGRETTSCEYAQELSIEGGRLDAGHSLVLASHPCGNGAYNFFSSAWVIDERGRASPAQLDAGGGLGEDDDLLVNAGWDAKTRRLTTFGKGRGLGDCGSGQEYAWDGGRFRLIHEESMGECRGSTDYITTWRATVR